MKFVYPGPSFGQVTPPLADKQERAKQELETSNKQNKWICIFPEPPGTMFPADAQHSAVRALPSVPLLYLGHWNAETWSDTKNKCKPHDLFISSLTWWVLAHASAVHCQQAMQGTLSCSASDRNFKLRHRLKHLFVVPHVLFYFFPAGITVFSLPCPHGRCISQQAIIFFFFL